MILNSSYDFDKNLSEREDYKRRKKEIDDALDKNTNYTKEVYNGIIKELLTSIVDQPEIIKFLKSRKANNVDALTQELSKITNNKVVMDDITTSIAALEEYVQESTILSKINEYSEVSGTARKNCLSLNIDNTNSNIQEVFTSISTLAKYTILSLHTVCLDCWYVQRELPYTSEVSRIVDVTLLDTCPTCHGNGIIHKISFEFPTDLTALFTTSNSVAYEVFIGYVIAKYDFIKMVYVHKKINSYNKDGKMQKGIESDIIAITNDDQLIIIEVTKQDDPSNLFSNLETKLHVLSEYEIPYDKLIYITASPANEYYSPGNKQARLFALKHLRDLETFMREFVTKNPPQNTT